MNNEEFLDWLEADPSVEWTQEIRERLSVLAGISSRGYLLNVAREEKSHCIRSIRWITTRNAVAALSI